MRYRTVAFALALLVIASDQIVSAQDLRSITREPDAAQGRPAGGSASITGRVTTPDTHAPVRRAQVMASSAAGARVEATTDDEGSYRLDRLAPGDWQITASKGGYVTWQFGQRRPFHVPAPITLAGGQRFVADIPLSRGGAIFGRVFGEFGEGLAGLQVRVYRVRTTQGHRRLEAVGAADLTDDNGAYRVYGLPPGDYYVAASLRVAPADSVVQTTYAPTYFPGTGSLAEAQRIRLVLGGQANATFAVRPFRRVRIAGVVLNSTGAPANAFLSLVSEAAEFGVPFGTGGVTRADGTFTLADLEPGRYTLTATLRGDEPDESASIPVFVDSDDVTGAMLVTGPLSAVRGTFVADAGVSRRLPGRLDVIAVSARNGGMVLGSDSGASFEIDSLTGPFQLSVDDLPDDWVVKDIIVNGQSTLDAPVELGPGQQADARIVLTDRVTEVSGVVAASDTTAAHFVVVFPEDPSKWGPRTRFVRLARTDARGSFRIRGLPHGHRYLAVATDYLEDGEHHDPEFLAGMRDFAAPFLLDEGGTSAVELRVVER